MKPLWKLRKGSTRMMQRSNESLRETIMRVKESLKRGKME